MSEHVLRALALPDRYERLAKQLGSDVANLLVAPPDAAIDTLRALATESLTRDEGILVPLFGRTGSGKTTMVMNVGQWIPTLVTNSCLYLGELNFDALEVAIREHGKHLPADNRRVIPVVIDHREGAPPSDEELAAVKRFLRTNPAGAPSLVFWPETNRSNADSLAERYVEIAGSSSVDLPVLYEGPERESWKQIAKHTLALANRINDLESLGVDPEAYDIGSFHSIGDFIRKLAHDFNEEVEKLRSELEQPISLVIAYASESSDPGTLAQLTSASRYGFLDAHALIAATPESEIGKWWSGRRGLLTRAIVQLNAHALCLAPTAAASCIRNFSESLDVFDTVGYKRYGPARGVRDLKRSDLGKVLTRSEVSRFEARGTPAQDAVAAFHLLAERGFNLGKDKKLNAIMADAIAALLADVGVSFEEITVETKLPFCSLIPDNAVFFADTVACVEFTWRKGDFLGSSNRSTVAQYALTKLQKYARQLGWTNA